MGKILVIGGANIDILGVSNQSLIQRDSNPGRVHITFGGVGRNIAENCCNMSQRVIFMSVIGSDLYGQMLKESCRKMGMDIRYLKEVEGMSSTYLAIMDEKHDLSVAISDMEILKDLEDDVLIHKALHEIATEDYLILDTNLSDKTIAQILDSSKSQIVLDPISISKAHKALPHLSKIDIIKPNELEAAVYCDFKITDDESALEAVKAILSKGVKEVLLTRGEKGVLVGNSEKIFEIKHDKIEAVNTTGAGDCFLATYVSCKNMGMSSEESAENAVLASMITIQSQDTVVAGLNLAKIKTMRKKQRIERKILCTFE